MAGSATRKTPPQSGRNRRQASSTASSADTAETDRGDLPERGLIGDIQLEAGSSFSAATRLRIRGLNVLAKTRAPEKEKVSITLDKPLVDEIRTQFGGQALSTSINELLYAALAQERLGELVDEMEQEAGPASPEAYERVLDQWFAES